MRPVAYPFDIGMIDRIEVKVIDVPGVVAFISNQMLLETPLPATGKISVAFRQHRQRVDPKGVRPTFFRNLVPDTFSLPTRGLFLQSQRGACATEGPARAGPEVSSTHLLGGRPSRTQYLSLHVSGAHETRYVRASSNMIHKTPEPLPWSCVGDRIGVSVRVHLILSRKIRPSVGTQ